MLHRLITLKGLKAEVFFSESLKSHSKHFLIRRLNLFRNFIPVICVICVLLYFRFLAPLKGIVYRIAGNFRGVKVSNISDIQIISENILSEFIHAYNHGTS